MILPGIVASQRRGGGVPASSRSLYETQLAGGLATLTGIGSYTWLNQGTATIGDSSAGVVLSNPTEGSDQMRGIYWTAPTPPYTITALVSINTQSGAGGGLGWKSAGSKFVSFGLGYGGGPATVQYGQWLDFDVLQVTPFTGNANSRAWLLLQDNGTNVYTYISYDGVNWTLCYSEVKASGYLAGSYGNLMFVANGSGGWIMTTLIALYVT